MADMKTLTLGGKTFNIMDAEARANATPAVTAADAGKFLRVSSAGKWEAEAVPNAEEASF